MPKHIGAIDQGTTSTRFIVFDRNGQSWRSAPRRSTSRFIRQPGWVEHDPEEIWLRTEEVVREAMAQANLRPGDLAAIGITNQRETTVVWDRANGRPVCNALVWQDTRVGESVGEMSRGGRRGSLPRLDRPAALPPISAA